MNEAMIGDLADFLETTGWQLIWGLNLGGGTMENAIEEAWSVVASAKDKLLAIEIGNELDIFVGVHRPRGDTATLTTCGNIVFTRRRFVTGFRIFLLPGLMLLSIRIG